MSLSHQVLALLKRGPQPATAIAAALNMSMAQVYTQLVRLEAIGKADCHVLTEPRRAVWYRT